MPTKSTASKTSEKTASSSHLPKVRKVNFNFLGKINITYILFFLLIIAAFLIGVLVTKVDYLEKGGVTNTNTAGTTDSTSQELAPQQPIGPVDVAAGHLPVLGDENAPVTLVEFSDFECPYCSALFTDTLPQIKEEYIDTGKAKLYYRHYPLTAIHPNAQIAAEASECANDQGQFWNYHDTLFENQTEWSQLSGDAVNEKLVELAGNIGLSTSEFSDCLTSGKFSDNVTNDLNDGIAAGVDGTPATFINGYLTVGAVPFEQFKSEIEARLTEN